MAMSIKLAEDVWLFPGFLSLLKPSENYQMFDVDDFSETLGVYCVPYYDCRV
jgi:hypothetical protein